MFGPETSDCTSNDHFLILFDFYCFGCHKLQSLYTYKTGYYPVYVLCRFQYNRIYSK